MTGKNIHESNGHALDSTDLPMLPARWCWTTLETIAAIEGGVTKDQKRQHTETTREVPYLRVANVQRGFLDLTEVKTILAEGKEIESLRLHNGDILFTEGGDRDKLGRGWVWNDEISECIHQNHIFRARPKSSEISSKFISYHGNLFGQAWFTKTGKQTTNLASINKGTLRRFPVPVAPANEQRRIVAKIEELFSDLDAGVAALERAKANLKRYRASVLKAAVDGSLTAEWRAKHSNVEPASKLLERILAERRRKWEADQLAKFNAAGKEPPKNWRAKYVEPSPPDTSGLPELPKGWCWGSVEQLVYDSLIGLDFGRQYQNDHRQGTPYVKMNNVTMEGQVTLDELVFVPASEDQQRRFSLLPGDLLFNTRNSFELVGKIGIVKEIPPNSVFNNNLMRLRTLVAPEYLCYAMCGAPFRQRMTLIKKATTNVAAVYAKDLLLLLIPLPPQLEQAQIAAEISKTISQVESADIAIERSLQRATRLRQSILKQAFEGKLVLQDPRDEPASELLDRIKSESLPQKVNGQSTKLSSRKKSKQKSI